jgi:hypothetical protein
MAFVVIVVNGNFAALPTIVALQGNAVFRIDVRHLDAIVSQMPIANLVNTVAGQAQTVLVVSVV